ncbi:MAG: cytochrome c maturation protein CcmE [Bacteroidota bacterium]
MKPKNIVGMLLLVGFASVLFVNFGAQVGGYMDFSTAAQTGSSAHVVGYWVDQQPISYDRNRNLFRFFMEDELGAVREVHYYNPKPPNFEDAEKLVVEGAIQGEVFVAEHILVKCPSKYNETGGLEEATTEAAG